MKKIVYCVGFAIVILLTSCGPKPYYKTTEGKKKLKRYNAIQYDTEH